MNNNVLKSNYTTSAFSSNYQANTQNTNEIVRFNNSNKAQVNFEVAKRKDKKEEKSSCCLINFIYYLKKNFIESRIYTPFALTIFTIIGFAINIMIFISSIIYSKIEINPKTPFFYELMNNWVSAPFKDINEYSDSNPNTDWYDFKKWGNTYLYFSYVNTSYKLILYNYAHQDKRCGKDTFGNYLYFSSYEDCPINDIYIDESNTGKTDYNYKNIDLKNGKYLHYTNEKTDGTIYVQLLIRGEGDYCKNQVYKNYDDDVCYYMDNCYVNENLYNITDCYQMDLYEKIDQCNYADFASNNGLIGGEYYKDDDKVSLYGRAWIGIDSDYYSYLNHSVSYYENIEVKYKWQLGLTILSVGKTAFFTLNEHFEWIKPWNGCLIIFNMLLTFGIFSLEIEKKSNVIKSFRAYYYLYYFIYDYLNKKTEKEYPSLEKKGFIRFYYLLLQIGYIIKLISEICTFIDYLKYFDSCTCNCGYCLNRECVKCKQNKCVINGFECTCYCEKCKNKECFLCEGASGCGEIKNVMLKTRCSIFQNFFKRGWVSFKVITVMLYVFIIFIIIFCVFFIKSNESIIIG